MKALRIFVALFVVFTVVCQAVPARAEIKPDFVKDFLQRYRPSTVTFSNSAAAATSSQQLADLVRSGQLPLTMGDLINLILQNNLDVGVNRLSPLSSQYLINTFYLPFEPTLHLQATVGRTTTAGTNSLAGAAPPPPLLRAPQIGASPRLLSGEDTVCDA